MTSVFHACARAYHTPEFSRHMQLLDLINMGIRPYLFEVAFLDGLSAFHEDAGISEQLLSKIILSIIFILCWPLYYLFHMLVLLYVKI